MLASAEIREDTQPQSVTGPFQAPGSEDINTYDGGLTISRDRCPPTIENVHTEISMTNGMTVLLNSEETPCHQYCFQKVAKKSNPDVRELKALGHIISPRRGHQQPTEYQLSSKLRPSKVGVYYLIDFSHVPAGIISSHSHHSHSHPDGDSDSHAACVAQSSGLLDCQASKGAVHRLDCAHHSGWHNLIPWSLRMRPRYNPRTSRSDYCWGNRPRLVGS